MVVAGGRAAMVVQGGWVAIVPYNWVMVVARWLRTRVTVLWLLSVVGK